MRTTSYDVTQPLCTELSALIIGATGATGKHLLREVLSSSKFSRVGEYGRRVTPTEGLPGKEKLEQKTIDFENLGATDLRGGKWDVVFITCVAPDCRPTHL